MVGESKGIPGNYYYHGEREGGDNVSCEQLCVWWNNLKCWKTGRAVRDLTKAFKDDDGFVLTWKCTIACALMDRTRLSRDEANDAADELMRTLFQVNPSKGKP